jgi:hypothetical protein
MAERSYGAHRALALAAPLAPPRRRPALAALRKRLLQRQLANPSSGCSVHRVCERGRCGRRARFPDSARRLADPNQMDFDRGGASFKRRTRLGTRLDPATFPAHS